MSILASLRHAGVILNLLPGDKIELAGATELQQQIVVGQKEFFLLALKAEAFNGPALEHSALMAGIERTYGQAVRAYWATPPDMERLVFLLDSVLADPWDRPRTLKDALLRYMEVLPEMKELIGRINHDKRLILTGKELDQVARRVLAKAKTQLAGDFI